MVKLGEKEGKTYGKMWKSVDFEGFFGLSLDGSLQTVYKIAIISGFCIFHGKTPQICFVFPYFQPESGKIRGISSKIDPFSVKHSEKH